ncbi:MAG: hypothetical protein JST06_05215, partial [Bacteroidetes bacterium]|nr:hypothetical protein [Bacteroidota bacterium]
MKALFSRQLAACALLVFSAQAALGQVSLTATGGTSTGSFTTLNSAFAAINAGTHTGSIVISITGNTTEPSTPTPLVASGSGSASYTKILIKAASGNDTINSASSPSSSRGIIELAGASNVTIDGDDPSTAGNQNLTIMAAMSSTSGIACIRLGCANTSGTGGASNDTIKNCIIIGSRNSATSTTTNYGIQYNNASSSNTSSSGAYGNINNAFIGNTILRCKYGMYLYGGSSSYPNTGILVDADTIGSSTVANSVWYGIYLYYASTTSSTGGPVIRNNDIQAGGGSGFSGNIAGIYISSYCGGATIIGNNIHNVANPNSGGWGAYGIGVLSSSGNNNMQIYNNFIRDITTTNYDNYFISTYQNYGIYLTGGTGYKINQNTIYLNAPNATNSFATNEVSGCLALTSTSVSISQMLNNIFINNQGSVSSNACAVIASGTSNFSSGTVNYNNYYVNGSGNIGYLGSTQTTLAAWRSAAGTDANSLNILPSFTSSTNLHIPTSTSSQLESGGASVSITGINKDIDGQTRPGPTGSTYGGASAPDIGADEFDGVPVRAPSVSGLSASAISCNSNISHTITATIVANSGTISSATINYNNGSSGTATMTLSSGTSANGVWTGTIPAASAGGTTVTWSITATSSIPLSTITSGASYTDNPLANMTAAAYAAPANVCTGSSTRLSARAYEIAPVQVGAGSTTYQYGGSPFYHGWGGARVEYIFTASELHAAGLDSGNISALSFDVTGAGASGGYAGFSISMGTTTTQTSYSYPPNSVGGLSVVYTSTSDTPTVGINTYNFSTPFYWNGTDNVVVAVCWSNNNTGGTSATVKWDYYSVSNAMYVYGDNQTVSTICGATGAGSGYYASTTSGRPVTYFTGPKTVAVTAYSWSNGASTVGTTNPLSLTPAASTTYTATLTATSGCTKNTNGVAVTLLPLPSAPTATNSLQCGVHVPTASVSGAAADSTYRWYDAALGGNLVQTGGSTYTSLVSKTDTFYVSIFNGQCESSRTPIKITVTQPDAVTASSPTNPYCANAAVSLVATKATGTNTYTYSWAATPTANSGITGSVSGGSISVTPLISGTFVYTVTAVDGACVAMSSDTIDVLNPPPAPIVTPTTPDSFCLGGSVALTASPGTAVAFSDMFENFPLTQWTTTGTGVTYNQSTTYYQQGSSSIWMSYNTNSDANLEMANNINLTQFGSPVLYFYQICATEAYYDYGYIQYSTDNGATWTSFPSSAYSGSGSLKNSVVSFDKSSYSDWSSQFSGSTTNPG